MNEATAPVLTLSEKDKARFWAKVDKSGGPGACWIWTAHKFHDGYGCFNVSKKLHRSHRLSFHLANGEIPKGDGHHGICVCHRCDVRECVNPAHLFLGTHQENVTDKMKKGRGGQRRGEGNGRAKLTEQDVIEMRKAAQKGDVVYKEFARKFNMDASSIKDAICGVTWRFLPPV